MATALMAHPELRHPFEETPIHPERSTTVLYQGRKNTLSEIGDGEQPYVADRELRDEYIRAGKDYYRPLDIA